MRPKWFQRKREGGEGALIFLLFSKKGERRISRMELRTEREAEKLATEMVYYHFRQERRRGEGRKNR